ncbi:LpxI family protein [Verrucomicrobia bacterium S94]|nr:LpxI family protein [Verrucomicrobia bacterium S94]
MGQYVADMNDVPESLIIIAGRDAYPLMLARAARDAGVKRIDVVAFKGETRREISMLVDQVHWVNLGSMQCFLDTLSSIGIRQCMMVGQIAPKNLFTVRMDRLAVEMYRRLDFKNAHTIFGAVVEAIENLGIEILPGNAFMECYTPEKGLLSKRAPTEREQADIALGLKLVKGTSDFEIGQTVALKEGIIVAVEAFEGTNQCIRRAGRVGKAGCVIVKVPKVGHDMRFDIPVVGTRTFRMMKKARVSCLAVEAGKTILLEQDKLVQLADRYNMAFVAVDTETSDGHDRQ